MIRVLWLTRKGEDIEDVRADVSRIVSGMWPGAVVTDGATAWADALPVTAGRFQAYIAHMASGITGSGPTFGAFVSVGRVVGKASADIVEAGLATGRRCYVLDVSTGEWAGPVVRVERGERAFDAATLVLA